MSDITTASTDRTLFLIDAYALIYRSYYALIRAPRINSKGMNTSAVMGFCNTLNEVMTKQKPTHLAVAFDHGKTFRHDAFSAYKAQRDATPEDITLSVPIIKDILTAYNIPILQADNYEADDVIGTVAAQAAAEGAMVYMLTPDKDYAQLVTDNIHMYRPRHGGGYEDLGPKEVCEKYGIASTSQVIDLLGLMGDASDNYPGCPGVGEKTAVKLINEFGSIEGLLSHSAEIKGKMREKVENAVEDIKLSKYLATIRTDVPISVALDEMRVQSPNEEKLREIFSELEFKSFADKLFGKSTANTKKSEKKQKTINFQPDLFSSQQDERQEEEKFLKEMQVENTAVEVQIIEDKEDIQKICEQYKQLTEYAFDIKTSSNDVFEGEIEQISLSTEKEVVTVLKISHDENERREELNQLKMLFEDAHALRIVQDGKRAIEVLSQVGIHLDLPLFDTMLAHYIINPDLHHQKQYDEEEYTEQRAAKIFSQKKPLLQKLKEVEMLSLFNDIETPLLPVLAEMEMNGVLLDTTILREVSNVFSERLRTTEQEIFKLAGEEFNISSPKQVGDILFGKLQIMDKPKKTKSGQFVTSEEVLQQLRPKNEIVGKILDYRGLKKLLSTYVEALPKLINKKTGHVHTSFNQCITATGRLSSSNPNLQNIPVRTDDGKEIRRCFIPEPGEEFFSADYSQVELRIMASMSGDKNMIEAFRNGHDIHAATSAKIHHKPIEEVTKDERRKAKSANFGIIYGISAFGLAQDLDIKRTEAKELIDNYFESFPQVMEFIEKCKDDARQRGYAVTLFGRRRYLSDINSSNGTVRAFAERNAVNAPIQGTAADIMKLAMINVYRRLKKENLHARMLLQVHDELNFSVPVSEREQVERIVLEEMSNAATLAVPLTADGGWGKNWLEAH